jgi:hypothetical protein
MKVLRDPTVQEREGIRSGVVGRLYIKEEEAE